MARQKLLAATVVFMTILSLAVYGQAPVTGTRIKGIGTANPRTVINFQDPDEATEIRRLLSQGNAEKALEMALQYKEQVEKSGMDISSRYASYNALCVVHTYTHKYEEAEQECTRAVETMPGHWSAWNNRGTTRYFMGDLAGAEEDYRRALENAGNMEGVVELVRFNLSFVTLRPQDSSDEDL